MEKLHSCWFSSSNRDSKGLYAILELEPEYMLQEEDVRHSRPFKLYYPVDASGNLLPTDIEIVVSARRRLRIHQLSRKLSRYHLLSKLRTNSSR